MFKNQKARILARHTQDCPIRLPWLEELTLNDVAPFMPLELRYQTRSTVEFGSYVARQFRKCRRRKRTHLRMGLRWCHYKAENNPKRKRRIHGYSLMEFQ